MSVVTPHQTDLTTFCKFKREHKLRRALHLLLNRKISVHPLRMVRTLPGLHICLGATECACCILRESLQCKF